MLSAEAAYTRASPYTAPDAVRSRRNSCQNMLGDAGPRSASSAPVSRSPVSNKIRIHPDGERSIYVDSPASSPAPFEICHKIWRRAV